MRNSIDFFGHLSKQQRRAANCEVDEVEKLASGRPEQLAALSTT